jgi:prolyl 4-hydroxylase
VRPHRQRARDQIVERQGARGDGAYGGAFAEPAQGQWYEVGRNSSRTPDFFKAYELEKFSTATWGQRTWTFMIYLNEPEGGGGTRFTELDLTIEPKHRHRSLLEQPHGRGRRQHLHDAPGHARDAGKKVIITKWFRRPPVVNRPSFTSLGAKWTQTVRT